MKLTVILLTLLISITANAQLKSIEKKKFHFGAEQDTSAGYTQALLSDNILYISGTVAVDVSPEGIRSVYTRIEKCLQYYGADFSHVVKENLYTTDIEAMKKHNNIRKIFYKNDFPAATWIQISRLYMPEAKLEVEVIAHLPKKQSGLSSAGNQ